MKKINFAWLALNLTIILTTLPFHSMAKQVDISEHQAIKNTLSAFHQAAANADTKQYFSLLSDDAVFIGTDATERWTKKEFKAFVQPYFSKGQGWLYTPVKQNISLLSEGNIAFFDELLHSESYGTCRGTGVLYKVNGHWKIAQYSLSIPLPNDLAKGFVKQIKRAEKASKDERK